MKDFDRQKAIKDMEYHATKLVDHFRKQGVLFSPQDGEMNNVVFTKGKKVVKISHNSFYRFSGRAVMYKDGKNEHELSTVEMTDAMFMDIIMKPIVDVLIKTAEDV